MDWTQKYLNSKVTIHYSDNTTYQDTGRITAIDSHWIELTKDNSDVLLVPVANIRIIKILEADRSQEERMLLRASSGSLEAGEEELKRIQ